MNRCDIIGMVWCCRVHDIQIIIKNVANHKHSGASCCRKGLWSDNSMPVRDWAAVRSQYPTTFPRLHLSVILHCFICITDVFCLHFTFFSLYYGCFLSFLLAFLPIHTLRVLPMHTMGLPGTIAIFFYIFCCALSSRQALERLN